MTQMLTTPSPHEATLSEVSKAINRSNINIYSVGSEGMLNERNTASVSIYENNIKSRKTNCYSADSPCYQIRHITLETPWY